jgi:hypothetical protein
VTTTSTTTTPATGESTDRADGQAAEPVTSADDILTVVAWLDPVVENVPGAMRTDSDDALVTGRGRVFELGECCGVAMMGVG